jgi:hypothetical protein
MDVTPTMEMVLLRKIGAYDGKSNAALLLSPLPVSREKTTALIYLHSIRRECETPGDGRQK